MAERKQTSGQGMASTNGAGQSEGQQGKKNSKKQWTNKSGGNSDDREVLLKVAGIEYRAPGKRQRIALGAIVLGGNILLVLAACLYFYNPAFKDFIYNLGR